MTGRERLLETMNGALKDCGESEAELVVFSGREDLSRCANSVIHQNVSTRDALVVARVARDQQMGTASTHGLDRAGFQRALKDAGELARFAPKDPGFGGFPGPAPLPDVPSHNPETTALGPEERARTLEKVFTAARPSGLKVAGAYAVYDQELAVVNSTGVAVHAPLSQATVNLVVMGEISSGFASGTSRDARTLDIPRLGEIALHKCLDAASPVEIEPGEYEVILEPAGVAELMEWMTYITFGARGIHEKTSALAGRMGERILGPNVTIYDDATEPGGIPTPFDFEGQPKRRLDIIEDGVARGYGTDSVWSGRLNTTNTAHAMLRSGDEVDPVPMNLFIGGGDVPAAEMVRRVERGLLVTRLHYVNGFLDTRRALMTGMTRDGTFLIEDGKVRGAVGNLRFTQSMIEALNDVRAISRERVAMPPWWSAAHNTGALSMPTLHLGSFNFTGRSAGSD